MALSSLHRTHDSLASFDRALALNPRYLPALQGAAELAYQSRHPRATELIRHLLTIAPQDATANAMAGTLAYEAGRCDEALPHLQRGDSQVLRDATARRQLADCLLATGRAPDALPHLRELLQRAPADARLRYNLGLALVTSGHSREAIEALEPLAAQPQPDPDALGVLASAYATDKRISDAIAALRRAITLAPRQEHHYVDLALLCLDHNNAGLALEIVNIGLQNLPQSAGLYTIRGSIHAHQSQMNDAEQDFEHASRLQPDSLYGSVGLSLLLRQSDRVGEAEALLRTRLRSAPRDPIVNYLLADVVLRQGSGPHTPAFTEADQALRRALAAKPDFAKAHAALGKLLLKQGNPRGAVRELEQALQQEPHDRTALQQMVLALRQTGELEQARRMADRLRQELDRERTVEVERNRIRLVRQSNTTVLLP